MPPSRIGVVLSAGGIRGVYAHTGFLQAAEEMDIPISAMAGCSAGAVVGGIYASGTALKTWAQALYRVRPEDFWPPRSLWCSMWDVVVTKGRRFTGISKVDPATTFCRKHLAVCDFEDCRIPFYALAICLASGEKTVFSKGDLAPRIVASAAIPFLFQPVEIEGKYFCDGAVIDLAPTDAICCKHGLDVLIVHHVANRKRGFHGVRAASPEAWPMVEILDTLLFRHRPWYLSEQRLAFRRCPCGCKALIVVLEPDLPELPWPQTQQGPTILRSACNQVKSLLAPHLEALCRNPTSLYALARNVRQIRGRDVQC